MNGTSTRHRRQNFKCEATADKVGLHNSLMKESQTESRSDDRKEHSSLPPVTNPKSSAPPRTPEVLQPPSSTKSKRRKRRRKQKAKTPPQQQSPQKEKPFCQDTGNGSENESIVVMHQDATGEHPDESCLEGEENSTNMLDATSLGNDNEMHHEETKLDTEDEIEIVFEIENNDKDHLLDIARLSKIDEERAMEMFEIAKVENLLDMLSMLKVYDQELLTRNILYHFEFVDVRGEITDVIAFIAMLSAFKFTLKDFEFTTEKPEQEFLRLLKWIPIGHMINRQADEVIDFIHDDYMCQEYLMVTLVDLEELSDQIPRRNLKNPPRPSTSLISRRWKGIVECVPETPPITPIKSEEETPDQGNNEHPHLWPMEQPHSIEEVQIISDDYVEQSCFPIRVEMDESSREDHSEEKHESLPETEPLDQTVLRTNLIEFIQKTQDFPDFYIGREAFEELVEMIPILVERFNDTGQMFPSRNNIESTPNNEIGSTWAMNHGTKYWDVDDEDNPLVDWDTVSSLQESVTQTFSDSCNKVRYDPFDRGDVGSNLQGRHIDLPNHNPSISVDVAAGDNYSGSHNVMAKHRGSIEESEVDERGGIEVTHEYSHFEDKKFVTKLIEVPPDEVDAQTWVSNKISNQIIANDSLLVSSTRGGMYPKGNFQREDVPWTQETEFEIDEHLYSPTQMLLQELAAKPKAPPKPPENDRITTVRKNG